MKALSKFLLGCVALMVLVGAVPYGNQSRITDTGFVGGTLTSALLLPDGTAAAPAAAFSSDADGTGLGFYRISANRVGTSTNGVLRFDVSTTAVTTTLPIMHPAGSVSAVAVQLGAVNDGWYSAGAGKPAMAVAGVAQIQTSSAFDLGSNSSSVLIKGLHADNTSYAFEVVNSSNQTIFACNNNRVPSAPVGMIASNLYLGNSGNSTIKGSGGSGGVIEFQNLVSNPFLFTSRASTSASSVFTFNATPSATGNLFTVQKDASDVQYVDTNGALVGPQRKTVANKTTAYQVLASDCGGTFTTATDGEVFTLPDGAAAVAGCELTFINTGANGAALLSIAPGASDSIKGTVAGVSSGGATNKAWNNVKLTALNGDYTRLINVAGSTAWYITGGVGVWASTP